MMHLRGGVGIRGIVSLWVICGAHVGPTMLGWEDEMDWRTILHSSGNLWRYRLRGLGMRQSGGCAEALLVGPFTAFLYIAEHDLCLQFLYLIPALELCIVYIYLDPR